MSVGVMKDYKLKLIYSGDCIVSELAHNKFSSGNKTHKPKTKEFTRLTYTVFVVELEHVKIETRLIHEKFVNTMGEYVTER